MICAAPRTGSTLLAQALRDTGRAGRPNEFFDIHEHNERFWINSLGITSDAEYFDKVLTAGSTENGIFGQKLHWHQAPALLAKLRAAPALADAPAEASLHELLTRKLGAAPRYIWMRRRDKLAQAISYLRAARTGIWRSTDDVPENARRADADLPFDFDQIAEYVRFVTDFDLQWQAFFRKNRLKVLMIVYENFIAAYEASVFNILEFLGIPRDGFVLTPPRLQRQADERTLHWRRRFLELASERGVDLPSRQPAAPTLAAEEPPLLLHAYQLSPHAARLVKSGRGRDWMDTTPVRFAYRCLPMVIANQHGWLLLNRHKFAVTWNGGPDPSALAIQFLSGEEPRNAVSTFGWGILTFTISYLFRTAPGYNLHVRGPANSPKDGIVALEGIVESDWTEATFTMNWKVTRPNHPVVFEENEPIAMISPLKRSEVERFRPELHDLAADPQLETLHREWAQSRAKHNADLKVSNSRARKEGWQRHYVRGISIRTEPAREHQTKLTLAEFADKRRSKPRP